MGSQSGFGPGFQAASSRLCRREYAAATPAILAYLVFRWQHLGGLDWPATALWLVLGTLYWPILGWLGHIAADRAVG